MAFKTTNSLFGPGRRKICFRGCAILAVVFLLNASVSPTFGGLSMNVDEILFEGSPSYLSVLNGTVYMDVMGNMLTITLTNTSSAATGVDGSSNLLTGVGFTLPTGYSISSGMANMASTSSAINWTAISTDVSPEWGFNNTAAAHWTDPAVLSYEKVVSALVADTSTQFSSGSLAPPGHLDGPDFGLLSASVPSTVAGGLEAIHGPLTIKLTLNSSVVFGGEMDFLNAINNKAVGIEFASPDQSSIPEAGTLAIWSVMGVTLCGIYLKRRG